MLPNDRLGVRRGLEAVRLRMSTRFPVCPRKRTYLERLPPPALRERRHRGLARRRVAVRRRAVLVVPEGDRPHPSHAHPHGGAAAFMRRPTPPPSASASKSSSFPSPEGRLAAARLRISELRALKPDPPRAPAVPPR